MSRKNRRLPVATEESQSYCEKPLAVAGVLYLSPSSDDTGT